MNGPITETANFVAAATLFTIQPNAWGTPYYQQVQPGGTAAYTVLPPAGYTGYIYLVNVAAACAVINPNLPPSQNPQNPPSPMNQIWQSTVNSDGSTTVTLTQGAGFPGAACQNYWQQYGGGADIMTLNVNVYGSNPNVAQQTLWVYLQVNSTPTISMSVSLLSKTATTATYLASLSTQGFSGTVNLGIQGSSCATVLGTPTARVANGPGTGTISVSTAACAAGTSTTLTITAAGNGVTANPQTVLLQTAPNAAVMTSPPPGATIPGGSTSFSWSTVTGATEYSLAVGSTPGANNVYFNGNLGAASSVSGVSVPTTYPVVYATLGTLSSGAWQYRQAVYTVNPSPPSPGLAISLGPTSARLPNTGTEVQYVYHFTGGDATRLNGATTTLYGQGVSARIVSQTANTATVGLTAARGTAGQPMEVQFSTRPTSFRRRDVPAIRPPRPAPVARSRASPLVLAASTT